MDFVTAVKTCLRKFRVSHDRASRSEYWYFTLFTMILYLIASLIDVVIGSEIGIVSLILALALLPSSLAVAVRRLHDRDCSGWWYLIALIPIAGIILLSIWFCMKGTPGPNRFGEDPLDGEPVAATPA